MAEENEIIAVFKADIEQYKAQMASMGIVNKKVEGSTDKVADSAGRLSTKTKSASGSISTLSRGLGGIAGLLGVTGRLFGVNTDKIESLVFASREFVRVGQDIARAQKLAGAATQTTTAAVNAQTIAQRALNLVQSAGVGIISLVVTGIVAAGVAVFNYVQNLNNQEKAAKRNQELDKAQIKLNAELAESFSKRTQAQREIILAEAVRTGRITEQKAEEISANQDAIDKLTKIEKDFVRERNKIGEIGLRDRGTIFLKEENRFITIGEQLELNRKKKIEAVENDLQVALGNIQEKYNKIRDDQAKKDADKDAEEAKKIAAQKLKDAKEAAERLLMQELDDMQKAADEKIKKAAEIRKEIDDADKADRDAFDNQAEKEREKTRKAEEKEAARLEKLRVERIEAEEKMLDTIFGAYQDAFDKRQALLDEERTEQEKAIEVQRSLAERGLANTLAFEEKRAAELRRQQQKEKENAKKVKLLETFLNSLAEFSKTDPKTALQKALLQVALATAATAVFAEEGGIIGEIGDRSNLRRKHRGGGDVLLHAQTGEGILSRKEMDNLGRRNFHLLKDAARFPIRDNVFAMPNVASMGGVAVNDNRELVKEVKAMRSDIKNMKQINFDLNQFGEYTRTQVENGVREITKGKFRKPRFR